MMTGGGGTFHFSGEPPGLRAAEGCSGTIECFFAATLDASVPLAAFAFLVFLAFVSLLFVPEAKEVCRREHKETASEHDAFDAFINRARKVTDGGVSTTAMTTDGPLVQRIAGPSTGGLGELTDAYEETVMSVPHFDHYGESLDEHMSAEFGTDIAYGVISSDQLTPPVKRSVIHAAREARDRRQKLLDVLDVEEESLATHGETLRAVEDRMTRVTEPLYADQTYGELEEARETLESCRASIEALCEARQADRREAQLTSLRLQNKFDLQQYLYSSMDVRYPVLAEATRLLSNIRIAERRIEDELIYRG